MVFGVLANVGFQLVCGIMLLYSIFKIKRLVKSSEDEINTKYLLLHAISFGMYIASGTVYNIVLFSNPNNKWILPVIRTTTILVLF